MATLSVELFLVVTWPLGASEAKVLTGKLLIGQVLAGNFSIARIFFQFFFNLLKF
jgi:hypothetical protein